MASNGASFYQSQVEEGVINCTMPDAFDLPRGSTKLARQAQEFAMTRFAYNKLNKLYEERRVALVQAAKAPVEIGTHVLCDTPQVLLAAVVVEGARKLDEERLRMMLSDRLDLGIDEAQALIDSCKVAGDPVTKLQVTLKR